MGDGGKSKALALNLSERILWRRGNIVSAAKPGRAG